jgi:hypothetical protein
MFEELEAFEERLSWIGASIPFFGPWLVSWKDVKTPVEKTALKRQTIAATGLALTCFAALVIAAEQRSVPPDKQAEADIRVLGAMVEEFRAHNGEYPDSATWGRTLDLGDPRYIDPWGRPYQYVTRNGYAMVGTYGRDAQQGGLGADADVWQTFGPAEPNS